MGRMYKIFIIIGALMLGLTQPACAEDDEQSNNSMVQREEFLGDELYIAGLPEFPPFSYYVNPDGKPPCHLQNVFIEPLMKASKEYRLKLTHPFFGFNSDGCSSFTPLILGVRDGNYQLFLGAYTDTKQFSGIEFVYPAVISNPIHILTLEETQKKIKSVADLQKMKGIACKSEYFSDFILRKMKDLNIEFVDTAYDAYQKIFTGEADYLLGSLYYHRIMSSRYGLERYLASSKKPLFKIPVFMAMSKLTPKLSEYIKLFQKISTDPQFVRDIKNEILRVVETEVHNNAGIVPPSFAKEVVEEEQQEEDVEEEIQIKGRVVEEEQQQKSIDEVLDGI